MFSSSCLYLVQVRSIVKLHHCSVQDSKMILDFAWCDTYAYNREVCVEKFWRSAVWWWFEKMICTTGCRCDDWKKKVVGLWWHLSLIRYLATPEFRRCRWFHSNANCSLKGSLDGLSIANPNNLSEIAFLDGHLLCKVEVLIFIFQAIDELVRFKISAHGWRYSWFAILECHIVYSFTFSIRYVMGLELDNALRMRPIDNRSIHSLRDEPRP